MSLNEYSVWDRTTRVFHWLNVLCVTSLIGVGTFILFASDLGVSNQGKIDLKTLHVWIGYVFVINLSWRLIWGFIGGPYARWNAVLPIGRDYFRQLRTYAARIGNREPYVYAGHNPLGRIAVTLLLGALLVQGVSGLVLAGTDVYMPPFGDYIAEWVASPDRDPAMVRPYAPETVNETSYQEMRSFRTPFIETHEVTYYVLLVLILLHISAVIVTEVRKGGTLISAMFTGRKLLSARPDQVLEKH